MTRLCGALVLLLLAGPAAAETGLPTANGLPIRVKAAVTFAEIESFSENTATFKATVDVRLRWQVLSLRKPAGIFRRPFSSTLAGACPMSTVSSTIGSFVAYKDQLLPLCSTSVHKIPPIVDSAT